MKRHTLNRTIVIDDKIRKDDLIQRLNRLSIYYTRRSALELNKADDFCGGSRVLAEDFRKDAIALNYAARLLATMDFE